MVAAQVDTKREAFLGWLDTGVPDERKTREDRARYDAIVDLEHLVKRKNYEHMSQCFAALRYDTGRRFASEPPPLDESQFAAIYDMTLDVAEYGHAMIAAGSAVGTFDAVWDVVNAERIKADERRAAELDAYRKRQGEAALAAMDEHAGETEV